MYREKTRAGSTPVRWVQLGQVQPNQIVKELDSGKRPYSGGVQSLFYWPTKLNYMTNAVRKLDKGRFSVVT